MYSAPVKLTITLVISLLAISSWALTFADYPAKSVKECLVSGGNVGVNIGLDAVEGANAQQMYFHMELAKKGFLPVFVVIENRAADSVIFDKSRINYGAAGSVTSTPPAGPEAAAMFAISAIPIVGVVASMDIIPKASEIRENLLKKEIQSATLSPGSFTRGFIYVPIPKKSPRGKIALRIPIAKAGTGENFDVNLIL